MLYINSNFTCDLLTDTLNLWESKLNLGIRCEIGPYNQVFQELLNPASGAYTNGCFNVLLIRLEEWLKDSDPDFLGNTASEFIKAAEYYTNMTKNEMLVVFTASSPEIQKNSALSVQIAKEEARIKQEFSRFSTVYVIDNQSIAEYYPVDDYFDELSFKLAHIPYTRDYFVALGTLLIRTWFTLRNSNFKAVAVDCDNTLWQGIIGEDGIDGITFNRGNLLLQERLIELYKDGILICLCSKNNEADVWEVLDNHPSCLLKREHILFHRINWVPKSVNILSLANEINIGADSFIFIDDNPAECEEVSSNSPATAFLFPETESEKIAFVKNNWLLYKLKITKEDLTRNQLYKEEKDRSEFLKSSGSILDFIHNLNLQIVTNKLTNDLISRVSQLSLRTNQFNFTTIRLTEDEVFQYFEANDKFCLTTHVTDKFGDYGMVGACFCKAENGSLRVENLFLSCRALGKGVEYSILAEIRKNAAQIGADSIEFPYIETSKNKPAFDFWQKIRNYASETKVNGETQTCVVKTEQIKSITFSPDQDKSEITEVKEKSVKSEKKVTGKIPEQLKCILGLTNLLAIKDQVYVSSAVKSNILSQGSFSKSEIEKTLLNIWKTNLNKDDIQLRDNYFDLGGKSINIPQIIVDIKKSLGFELKMADFFGSPSVVLLSEFIYKSFNPVGEENSAVSETLRKDVSYNEGIAIIGMAGHFPGAGDIGTFWENIKNGVESISFYTREELEKKGVHPELLNNPNYIYANGVCEDADKFDSAFFGYTPREADLIDPQQRLLLETCYEALEHAGYAPEKYSGDIGVFAGSGPNNYLLKNLIQHPELLTTIGELQTIINNDKDYLATRVSYKLNLTGPGINVQTACSTSLVAVHLACQSLINYQSDIALAGGSFVQSPRGNGYMYQNGSIFSSDGHCRPFDKEASGMLFGEGSGVVALKRLDEAVRDHDYIWAVIKATAINNDGSRKAGYMAPSVDGQARVIAAAQAHAGVKPNQVSYIETHGTGTHMGDPIEIGALTKTFNTANAGKNYCAIGSVKANIGHLDAAAGVSGLIKTSLSLHHKQIPPSINFNSPNPDLHIEDSPFFVNNRLQEWETNGIPRTAGVSSFGVGGTNCHCIVQEWEQISFEKSSKPFHLLPFSAKTDIALQKLIQRHSGFLQINPHKLADVAYTLQNGRNEYKFRSIAILPSSFENGELKREVLVSGKQTLENPGIVFMFTGQGSQYVNMGRGLYDDYLVFRQIVDRAAPVFEDFCKFSLTDVLFGKRDDIPVNNTAVAQPLLFVVQYGLSELLKSFGIKPSALIGHSIGEITAACVSGVYTFEEALYIVLNRGKIMQAQTPGSMLSVNMPKENLLPLLPKGLEISLINAPNFCVVSGSNDDISAFANELSEKHPGIQNTRLATSHAFHSYLMEPALEPFKKVFDNIKPGNISIPFISNTHGTWITQEQASSPGYWAEHIRNAVDFKSGMEELLKDENSLYIEVGPGSTLTTFLSQFNTHKKPVCIPTLRHPKKEENDSIFFLKSLANVWINGGVINWGEIYKDEIRCRVPLPLYPFEKRRHWIAPVVPFSYDISYQGFNTINSENYFTPEDENTDGGDDFRASIDSEYTAPQSEMEKDLVRIWEDLLGIPKIGTSDNFFDLGGHSLLASQIINRVNEKFKIDLPLKTIFNSPTIALLVGEINNCQETEKIEFSIEPISNCGEELPVSLEQQRLWIVSKIFNSPSYNIPFTYKFIGDLNIELFKKSLELLFSRHKILKSSIKTKGLVPVCKIDNSDDIPLTLLDYTEMPQFSRVSELNKFLTTEIRGLFNIENGPLYRIYLIKTGDNEYYFQFTVQHLVFDGWSWGIFVKEFKQIYSDLKNNRALSLPEPQYQYFDYAAWQSKNNQDLTQSIEYWKKQLEGYTTKINYPYNFDRKRVSSGLGGREGLSLDANLVKDIKKIGQTENVTDFMILVSIWAVLLKQYSGDNDINIGTPTANRSFSQLEHIVGFFVNSLVLRFKFTDELTFRELLINTRQVVFDALAHQDLPFEKLVEELKPPRAFNINPVFQMMFAWQNTPRPPLDLEGIASERILVKECVSALDITFYMWEENEIMEGEIEFSTDIISRESIVKMKEDFHKLIDFFVKNPQAKVVNNPFSCY